MTDINRYNWTDSPRYFQATVKITHWKILGEPVELKTPVTNTLFCFAQDETGARQEIARYLERHGDRGEILTLTEPDVPF